MTQNNNARTQRVTMPTMAVEDRLANVAAKAEKKKQDEWSDTVRYVSAIAQYLVVFIVLAFSWYHGYNVAKVYTDGSRTMKVISLLAIGAEEAYIFNLHAMIHMDLIVNKHQRATAWVSGAFVLVASVIGIWADSRMNAGLSLSPFLSGYIQYGTPIAPILVLLFWTYLESVSPQSIMKRLVAVDNARVEEELHMLDMQVTDVKNKQNMEVKLAFLQSSQEMADIVRKEIQSQENKDRVAAYARNIIAPALLKEQFPGHMQPSRPSTSIEDGGSSVRNASVGRPQVTIPRHQSSPRLQAPTERSEQRQERMSPPPQPPQISRQHDADNDGGLGNIMASMPRSNGEQRPHRARPTVSPMIEEDSNDLGED